MIHMVFSTIKVVCGKPKDTVKLTNSINAVTCKECLKGINFLLKHND
jgi:hypothetical protein